MADDEHPAAVEFFFDPMCPWAYQASLWIREVRRVAPLAVTWRFFSLEEINREEGKKHPWEREWSYGWSQMRVGAWLRRRDPDLVDRWYGEAGAALFDRGEASFTRAGAEQVVTRLGLPATAVADALDDPTTHDDVRSDHDGLVSHHGGHGVPTLVFPDGQALFGPVVVPAPRGDDALALWRLVEGWRAFPHLYELRRPKTATDQQHIGSAFATYLDARAWRTIQHPAA